MAPDWPQLQASRQTRGYTQLSGVFNAVTVRSLFNRCENTLVTFRQIPEQLLLITTYQQRYTPRSETTPPTSAALCLDRITWIPARCCLTQRSNEYNSRAVTCESVTTLRATTLTRALPMASAPAPAPGNRPSTGCCRSALRQLPSLLTLYFFPCTLARDRGFRMRTEKKKNGNKTTHSKSLVGSSPE